MSRNARITAFIVVALAALAAIWFGTRKATAPNVDRSIADEISARPAPAPTPVHREIDLGSEEVEPAGAWSTYHGGPSLTGAVNVSLAAQPAVAWRYQADSPILYTPVSDGDRVIFATMRGSVGAVDLEGREIWFKQLYGEPYRDGRPRKERFEAPIACFDSTVLIGSTRGTVYAFDSATGDEKWKYKIGSTVLGTLNVHRPSDSPDTPRVFIIQQDDGALHSLDLETGELLWKGDSIDRCDGSPSVAGDAVVYGSCAAALHVFSAQDGALVRNIAFDGDSQVAGGVALAGGSAYSGSHSGRVFRVDLAKGEIVWINEDTVGEVFSTPAVDRELVVFASDDGGVFALDRETGELRWKCMTDGTPTSTVIAGEDVVFASDGILYILRRETGEVRWSFEVSDEITSPALLDGMIVVGGDDGTVTAFR